MSSTSNLKQVAEPVSVIIPYSPAHTPERMYKEAVQSAESQDIPVDVIPIKDTDQNGPAWARNAGLKKATTRYVAFLDADDIWKEGKLTRQISKMKETNAGICVEGEEMSDEEFLFNLAYGNIESLPSSIVIDSNAIDIHFDENLERREDHLFMMEAASQGGVCLCKNLVTIRKHSEGLTNSADVETMVKANQEFIAKVEQRIPEASSFIDEIKMKKLYNCGRRYHYDGQYANARSFYKKSLIHKPNIKSLLFYITAFVKSLYPF